MNSSTGWITILAIIVVIGASIALYALREKELPKKAKPEVRMPSSLPDGTIQLPVLEIYGGLKGLGSLSLFQNKKNPEIQLNAQHLTYKVMKTRTAAYDQIKWACATYHPFYFKVHIVFRDRSQSLIAYLPNEETLRTLMEFLETRGVLIKNKN
jgi:hypothetical protein